MKKYECISAINLNIEFADLNKKDPYGPFFIVNQNHALDAWFGKNYIVEADIKTPLLYNKSAVCQLHKEQQRRVV